MLSAKWPFCLGLNVLYPGSTKPLPEPMMTQFIVADGTYITRPQCVNSLMPGDILVCTSDLGHHWIRQWLGACLMPSHNLNQYWHIFNYIMINISPWNIIRKPKVPIQENVFETASAKSKPFYPSLKVLLLHIKRTWNITKASIKGQKLLNKTIKSQKFTMA